MTVRTPTRSIVFLLALLGCGRQASADRPLLRVVAVTSASATVSWPAVRGARRVRVFLGPEPARTAAEPLPGQVLLATLDGSATRFDVVPLAAGVEAFVRVEAETAAGLVGGNAAFRTAGGPRAPLAGPVREVHLLAPDVLQVVLANGDGAAWRAGPWVVTRASGAPLRVLAVHRDSVPVGQPSYGIGPGAPNDTSRIDVDHRIALRLAQPVGSADVLRIRGPAGVELLLPFSDRRLETPVIQLNQVGYNPRARQRWAYVSGWLGDGGPLPLAGFPATAEAIVAPADPAAPRTFLTPLSVAPRASFDRDAGTEVRQIDLAAVPAGEGRRIRIRVPGVGVSWPTQISEQAAFKAFYVVARGLFHNRWGGDLRASCTEWTRPPDHPTVFTSDRPHPTVPGQPAFFPRETPRTGRRPLQGGYHDAGDFDQRPHHTVVPQLVLRAFELGPERFADGQLTIPESGNRIPDLLDEALWGVRAWEELQEQDGGVRAGVESFDHPDGVFTADQDPLPYWTFARDPNVSARAAGVFAQAARLLAPFDAARSAELRRRALGAYEYARRSGARDAFAIYGMSELYRLTGERRYAQELEAVWTRMSPEGIFGNFAPAQNAEEDYVGGSRVMADYVLGYLGAPGASVPLRELARRRILEHADAVVRTVETAHAHRNAREPRLRIVWGQGTFMGRFVDTLFAALSFPEVRGASRQRYFDTLSLVADFLLGANATGISYVTGLGSRRPEEPMHHDSLVMIRRGLGPIPGIPIYGPSEELPREIGQVGRDRFYPAFEARPPMLRYDDVRISYVTNEFTVWTHQAPDVELFATLIRPGMRPPASWLPGGREHRSPLP